MDLQKECLEMVVSAQKFCRKFCEGKHSSFNFHVVFNYIKFFAYMNKEVFEISLSEAKSLPCQSYNTLNPEEFDAFKSIMTTVYNAYFLPHSTEIYIIIDNPIISYSYVKDVLDEFVKYHISRLASTKEFMARNRNTKYEFKQKQRCETIKHYYALMVLEYIERVYENPMMYGPGFVIDVYKLLDSSNFDLYTFDSIIKKSQRCFENTILSKQQQLHYLKNDLPALNCNAEFAQIFKDFARLFKKYDIIF